MSGFVTEIRELAIVLAILLLVFGASVSLAALMAMKFSAF
jgi:Sec-independent protein translocase protein TatA